MNDVEYKCNECGKTFENGQKLGGHKSSHNRGESFRLKRQTEKSKLRREKSKRPHHCKFCNKEFETGPKLGSHVRMCKLNPNYSKIISSLSKANTGKSPSEATKLNLSESMKLAHAEGRAWNIGQSRWNNKPSYPELFFIKVIENEFKDKEYIREYPFSKYSIDFAWVHLNKAIEIDGSQHERFKEYKDRDKLKDKLLIKNGWSILRIKWKDMYNDPKKFIKIAKDFIQK